MTRVPRCPAFGLPAASRVERERAARRGRERRHGWAADFCLSVWNDNDIVRLCLSKRFHLFSPPLVWCEESGKV
eukprot:6561361-Prymnesium_polylepis.1